jgi:hypothetical protein
MKYIILLICLLLNIVCKAQRLVNLDAYDKRGKSKIAIKDSILNVSWPADKGELGKLSLDLSKNNPLFKSIELSNKQLAKDVDPAFILTIGKRDLISQNGWNIFFDKVPDKPHQSYTVQFNKQNTSVTTMGTRTIIRIGQMNAASFSGVLEITLYDGSSLFNVASVLSTNADSTAILYDAGLISKTKNWDRIGWSDTKNMFQYALTDVAESSKNVEVKYRTIIGENNEGCIAVFPAPHQYFYPLDEAFNLKFTWYGNNYRNMLLDYGIGIRQDLEGDKRFVPWFNAPPHTMQRLNFFCFINPGKANETLEKIKEFTHNDSYIPLKGYKTMSSHFHNEFIMNVVMKGKPVPEHPAFVGVFKNTGVNIVHLAEFHYTAHSKGPDEQRLKELDALFNQCKRLSDKDFLLLPGEEPNEFFGGHWLELFPKPVYWIMSRNPDMSFVTEDPEYGKVYRIADKNDMLRLLQAENGLAWTAHARTKGSVGFPDAYKDEPFFKSDHFMGAAWKAMPADLSQPRLGKRVLDLMDDMNNWGLKKHVIGEADLFSIEPENEMYAHLNVNYLQLKSLPKFEEGWQPVLDVIKQGKFFTTTGEVLLPYFIVNGKGNGETVPENKSGKVKIELGINWTFPLNFAEIISGDGKQVYREKINLENTGAFGNQKFVFNTNLKNRTWVRVEVWDVAANGAFTQSVWLNSFNRVEIK